METRGSSDAINVYESGNTFEVYIKPQGNYDATITDVVFTISSSDSTIEDSINKSYKSLSSDYTSIDGILRYSRSTSSDPNNKYGIRINAFGNLSDDQTRYTISAQVKFSNSSKNITKTIDLIVQEDSVPIASASSGTTLYMTLADSYEDEFSTAAPADFYKYHLAQMTRLYLEGINTSYASIDNIIAQTGQSILKYLTSLQKLSAASCR